MRDLIRWTLIFVAASIASTNITSSYAADLYDPSPIAKTPTGVADRKRRDYDPSGLRFANWLFSPSVLTSVTYDDNIFATRRNKVSDTYFHLVPNIAANGDFGATTVSAFVTTDMRISTQQSNLSAVSPGAGVGFKSEIQRDLVVLGQAAYGYRLEDPSQTNLNSPGSAIRDLIRYHDFTSNLSINKSFNQFFVSAGAAYQHLAYDDVRNIAGTTIDQSGRDADLLTWTLRGGYEVSPGLKIFVEPSYNIRRFGNSRSDSQGWRLVGGVSGEMSKLVTGEVYAGYSNQDYDFFRASRTFVAGVNIRWFPTELLTVSLRADRGSQDVSLSQNNAFGATALVTNASIQADYELLRNLILTGKVAYQNYDYRNGTNRRTDLFTSSLTASYLFSRFLTGSLDFRNFYNDSNVESARYTRNQFTASLKGQF